MKRYMVVIDTDPGIDDIAALVFALHDPQYDIKLIAVNCGNMPIEKASHNLCHLLDIFNKDIPVVNGYSQRLGNNNEHAEFLHGKFGMGNYIPPKSTKHKPLKKDCADAIYDILKDNPKEVTIIILGSHTNFANLLIKHPDAKDLIKNVLMMGGAPDGIEVNPNHNSFNIRTDAPAFRYTINSKLPIVMCPSRIGRDVTYFSEEQVEKIKNKNLIGKFLAKTFETYWEPGYNPRILSNCDLAAIYYLTHRHLYKTKRAFIKLNTTTGKTVADYDRKGNFKIVKNVNRKKFLRMIDKKLDELGKLNITDKTFLENIQENAS